MDIKDLEGKKITVMGLGLHGGGIGTVRFLSEAGATLIVTDLKTEEELSSSLEKLKDLENVEYVLGQHRMEDFSNVDMVIKNPAARWDNEYVKAALDNNVSVEMDSSLFFKFCKNPIIGVTGTRGKTTTASLIYEILKVAGKNPIKIGIGQVSVLDKWKELEDDSIVVFELSSWRLSALGRYGLSPHIAVFTNLFQDHLNYYKNIEEYLEDKKNIYKNQETSDFCIINEDNEILRGLESEIKSQLIKFSYGKTSSGKSVYVSGGHIYLNDGVDEKKIISLDEIKLRGTHNVGNILASIGVAYVMNIGAETIRKALSGFNGLPHRLEFVRELEGVKYYNDTAATSPDGAISGVGSFSEPVVLICGGSDKNLDMAGFAKVIAEKAKAAVFLKGATTDKIISALKVQGSEQGFIITSSMAEAVEEARRLASAGDVILLSPGSASFGLFLNEFDRGDKFKEAVSGLK